MLIHSFPWEPLVWAELKIASDTDGEERKWVTGDLGSGTQKSMWVLKLFQDCLPVAKSQQQNCFFTTPSLQTQTNA